MTDPRILNTLNIFTIMYSIQLLWYRHPTVFVNRRLLHYQEDTTLSTFIYILQHVSAVCVSHLQVESQQHKRRSLLKPLPQPKGHEGERSRPW